MGTLTALWQVLEELVSDVAFRVRRKKQDAELRRIGAEAANRHREEMKSEQALCGRVDGHKFVHVYSGSLPDFDICLHCRKIGEIGDRVYTGAREDHEILSSPDAYADSGKTEEELYAMPLEQLEALAR